MKNMKNRCPYLVGKECTIRGSVDRAFRQKFCNTVDRYVLCPVGKRMARGPFFLNYHDVFPDVKIPAAEVQWQHKKPNHVFYNTDYKFVGDRFFDEAHTLGAALRKFNADLLLSGGPFEDVRIVIRTTDGKAMIHPGNNTITLWGVYGIRDLPRITFDDLRGGDREFAVCTGTRTVGVVRAPDRKVAGVRVELLFPGLERADVVEREVDVYRWTTSRGTVIGRDLEGARENARLCGLDEPALIASGVRTRVVEGGRRSFEHLFGGSPMT